jgi:hypothetical protein
VTVLEPLKTPRIREYGHGSVLPIPISKPLARRSGNGKKYQKSKIKILLIRMKNQYFKLSFIFILFCNLMISGSLIGLEGRDISLSDEPEGKEVITVNGKNSRIKNDNFVYNQLKKIEAGILFAYLIPSFRGKEIIQNITNEFNFLGGEIQFLLFDIGYLMGAQKQMDSVLYFNIHYGRLNFQVASDAGKHHLQGEEYYFQTGMKQNLFPSFFPFLNSEISSNNKLVWDPYIKIGMSVKVNTHGEITYPRGPRPFSIGSLNQLTGLVTGTGIDFRSEWITVSAEVNYIFNFSEYQSKRKFTFSDLRDEFDNVEDKTSIQDVVINPIQLNIFQVFLIVRYRFSSLEL